MFSSPTHVVGDVPVRKLDAGDTLHLSPLNPRGCRGGAFFLKSRIKLLGLVPAEDKTVFHPAGVSPSPCSCLRTDSTFFVVENQNKLVEWKFDGLSVMRIEAAAVMSCTD